MAISKTMIQTASPVPNHRWSKEKNAREWKVKPWVSDKVRESRKKNTWWTKEELHASELDPSEEMHATSSPVTMAAANAILSLEVLSASKLPNEDGGAIGTALGKKTDAFVGIVVDNHFGLTSTINNCLSPIWPPFTRRGFEFPIISTSRLVHIGVFDSDEGDITGGLSNDFIAKALIDLSSVRSGVQYTVVFKLFNSTTFTTAERREAEDCGTLKVRYSLRYNEQAGPRMCMLHDLKCMLARGYPEVRE